MNVQRNKFFSASGIFLSTSLVFYLLFLSFFLFELFHINYQPFFVEFSCFSLLALIVTFLILLLIIIDLCFSYLYLDKLDKSDSPVPIDLSFWKYFIANCPWVILIGISFVFSLNAFSKNVINMWRSPYFWVGLAIIFAIPSGITFPKLWEKEISNKPKDKKEFLTASGKVVFTLKFVFNLSTGILLILSVIFKWTEWSSFSLLVFYLINRLCWDSTIYLALKKVL